MPAWWGAAVLAAALAVAGPVVPGGEWTQPDHDAGHTRYNPDETELTASTVGDVVPLWRAPPGPPAGGQLPAGDPIVTGGRLFLKDVDVVSAYDAAGCGQPPPKQKCAPVWSSSPFGVTSGTLTFAGGSLFVPTRDFVYALDPATGAERWRMAVDPPAGFDNAVSVRVSGALGYTEMGDGVAAFSVDGCGQPVCRPQWRVRMHLWRLGPPVVEGDVMLLQGSNNREARYFAFHASGCGASVCSTPLWQTGADDWFGGGALRGGVFVAGTRTGSVRVFDATGCGQSACDPQGATPETGQFVGGIALTDTRLVVRQNATLFVFDRQACVAGSCFPLWEARGGSAGFSVAGDLLWWEDIGGDGETHAFDIDGCGAPVCEPIATLTYRGSKHAGTAGNPPVVVGGRVYVRTMAGVIVFALPHDSGA